MKSSATLEQPANRYANDWNRYSDEWNQRYGPKYEHLGDEWHDEGSGVRSFEQRMFAQILEPWLTPASRVLEIGPGGGKWTVRIAPRVRQVTVFDVAKGMLDRTRERVDREGLTNVSYVLGSGCDLSQIPSGSVDIVFSYDVFVHIALEETVAYVADIARVLRDGGLAIVHHAVGDVHRAWDRIEEHNEWYRERRNTLGQFYYYSQDTLDRLYTRHGLRIENWSGYYCTTTITAVKPADSIVPRLEESLRLAATAGDEVAMTSAIAQITGSADALRSRLDTLTEALRTAAPGSPRYAVIQKIRRLIRG